MKLLAEEGVGFDRVDYFVDAFDADALGSLLAKARLGPRDVLRKREKAYKELGLEDSSLPDDVLIDAIVEHPSLLQRPIIERGDRAVLGRPIERVRELF